MCGVANGALVGCYLSFERQRIVPLKRLLASLANHIELRCVQMIWWLARRSYRWLNDGARFCRNALIPSCASALPKRACSSRLSNNSASLSGDS
jgi:hypothetical protein